MTSFFFRLLLACVFFTFVFVLRYSFSSSADCSHYCVGCFLSLVPSPFLSIHRLVFPSFSFAFSLTFPATNDLDVDTLRNLENALTEYAGTAIIISHDRYFLDR